MQCYDPYFLFEKCVFLLMDDLETKTKGLVQFVETGLCLFVRPVTGFVVDILNNGGRQQLAIAEIEVPAVGDEPGG